MKKTTKRSRFFLDTSAVFYHRHGHSLMQGAVQQAVGNGLLEVSNFIRMEYLRGVVINLIDLYFLIKESDSVSDALIDWFQKVNQERKLKIVGMTMRGWLLGHTDWQDKGKSMRRLGDEAVRLVFEFDRIFSGRSLDRLECQLGGVQFPRRAFSEDMLLEFYEQFKAIQTSIPACLLCRFKSKQRNQLTRRGIDLYSPLQQQKYAANKGYVQQAQRLFVALASQDPVPKCRWCEQLGDTVIILQAPAKATLVTADRAFLAFGDILNREIRLLPSLAELKRQSENQSHEEDQR